MSDFFVCSYLFSLAGIAYRTLVLWKITQIRHFSSFDVPILIGHPMSCCKNAGSDTIKSQQGCIKSHECILVASAGHLSTNVHTTEYSCKTATEKSDCQAEYSNAMSF